MKKVIHLVVFTLLASFMILPPVHADSVKLYVGYGRTVTGKSIPIHNGTVYGTVNQEGGPGKLDC